MTDESKNDFKSSYPDGYFGEGIVRAFQNKPFVMAGVFGMMGTCGYGYWRYKNKGYQLKPSIFLLQLRVAAQSVVVGCITIGMLYNMYQVQMKKRQKD